MIQLENITASYHAASGAEVIALHDVSVTINRGDHVMVVGSNGSGKSTLLNMVSGTRFPASGKILITGKDITRYPDYRRSPMIARVFQDPFKGTVSDLSILENFRLAALRTGNKKLFPGINSNFRQTVCKELSRLQLGIENDPDRLMANLSGGQRQAITLLMAVMSSSEILLMDEPTSALDPKTSDMVMRIANELIQQHHLTTIHVTHRMKDAALHGNRIIMMKDGKIERDLQGDEKKTLNASTLFEWFA